jgi:hypothetical protein
MAVQRTSHFPTVIAMRELPILMNGAMVRAVLEGRKTVTRRPVKPLKGGFVCVGAKAAWDGCSRADYFAVHASPDFPQKQGNRWVIARPGDRVYVRETHFDARNLNEGRVLFQADGDVSRFGWTPSLHMPKALARIWLEVTAVRVERLHEIDQEQAMAEGLVAEPGETGVSRSDFIALWNSVSKTGSHWGNNPWVWVVEFRRIDGGTH